MVFWIFWFLLGLPSSSLAHGLDCNLYTQELPYFEVYFLPQESASFAEVKVIDPTTRDILLRGQTDFQGRFALPPFTQRVKVEIKAGMGHKKIFYLEPHSLKKPKTLNNTPSLFLKIILGLSLLLNGYLLARINTSRKA